MGLFTSQESLQPGSARGLPLAEQEARFRLAPQIQWLTPSNLAAHRKCRTREGLVQTFPRDPQSFDSGCLRMGVGESAKVAACHRSVGGMLPGVDLSVSRVVGSRPRDGSPFGQGGGGPAILCRRAHDGNSSAMAINDKSRSASAARRESAARSGAPSRRTQPGVRPKVVFGRSAATEDLPPRVRAALRVFFRDLAEVRLPPVTRVVLFGSRARGDSREDSDLDLAVVFAGEAPPPGRQLTDINERLADPAEAALEEEATAVSPIAVWEEELGDGTTLPDWPFHHNLVTEGIELGADFGTEGRVHPRQPEQPRGRGR